MSGLGLVCLLPARNCESDLPGYIESVRRFADAVVALDDGSTDATREILAGQALVRVLRSNPVRDGYQGWDDAANRNLLLEAAAPLQPRWIMSLDADERVSEDDAAALREFLDTEALAGVAYGFRVFRMIDNLRSYDKCALWVYRLFRYRPGQRFPSTRLHFVPVPTDIPRGRWIKTTVRIQHLASLTEAHRRRRYEKYNQADPRRVFQADYHNLLDSPRDVKPWCPRPRGLPVPLDPGAHARLAEAIPINQTLSPLDPRRPTLSAIVIAHRDEARIAAVMDALVDQRTTEPFEVILVASGGDRTARIVSDRHPHVRIVELTEPALPGAARNAGLALARGDFISFPGSHVLLLPGSLEARIRAHYLGYEMVAGTVLNGTPTIAGWASYFLDHSECLPGRPSSPLGRPPSHCSYLRWPLLELGGFPESRRAGEDTFVNRELWRRGHLAYRSADIRLIHQSPCTNPLSLVRHHFQRGQGFGRILLEARASRSPAGDPGEIPVRLRPLVYLLLIYPIRRLCFLTGNVVHWGRGVRLRFLVALPLIIIGVGAALAGALVFLLRPAGQSKPTRSASTGRSKLGKVP